jgi:hypothetical protein
LTLLRNDHVSTGSAGFGGTTARSLAPRTMRFSVVGQRLPNVS